MLFGQTGASKDWTWAPQFCVGRKLRAQPLQFLVPPQLALRMGQEESPAMARDGSLGRSSKLVERLQKRERRGTLRLLFMYNRLFCTPRAIWQTGGGVRGQMLLKSHIEPKNLAQGLPWWSSGAPTAGSTRVQSLVGKDPASCMA